MHNDIHVLFTVHFGMLLNNNPSVSDVSLLVVRYLDDHSRDVNLTEAVTKYVNNELLCAEVKRLCKRGRYEKAYALECAGSPINRFEITEWIQANGFHRVLGKFKGNEIIVMVSYERLNIKAVQLAVKDTEFEKSVDEFAKDNADNADWNACPTMHIADWDETYSHELCTFNLKEL